VDVSAAIEAFLTQRRTGRKVTPATLALYKRQLTRWKTWRAGQSVPATLSEISLDEFDRFFAHLTEEAIPHANNPRRPAVNRRGLAPETVATIWRVLRAFWRFCRQRGWVTAEQAHYFGRDGINTPPVPEEPRPVYDDAALAAVLQACGDGESEESARDRAIVTLLWDTGLRIAELCGLDDSDVDLRLRRGRVRAETSKGKRTEPFFWTAVAAAELLGYLRYRRGRSGGPLLRGTTAKNNGGRLTPDSVRSRLKRLCDAADVELIEGSPLHGLRRAFIQRGIDKGLDISQASQFARHRDIRTTMRYARRQEETLADLYEQTYSK
jgi:site-specific recombinase XerD